MDLSELRKQIDALDGEILGLLERRMDVSAQIAGVKREKGLPVLDERREAEKLESIRARCRPELADYLADVYVGVFAASRRWQSALLGKQETGK